MYLCLKLFVLNSNSLTKLMLSRICETRLLVNIKKIASCIWKIWLVCRKVKVQVVYRIYDLVMFFIFYFLLLESMQVVCATYDLYFNFSLNMQVIFPIWVEVILSLSDLYHFGKYFFTYTNLINLAWVLVLHNPVKKPSHFILVDPFLFTAYIFVCLVQAWGNNCYHEWLCRAWITCSDWIASWWHKVYGDPRWARSCHSREEGNNCLWL